MQPYEPQGLNPSLFKQQAQGLAAQNKLSELLRGQQMTDAYAKQNAALPEMQGRGLASVAPNIFQTLNTAMDRRQGRQDVSKIQAQADQLRGDMLGGSMAELEAGEAQAMRDANLRAEEKRMAAQARAAMEAEKAKYRENLAGLKADLKGDEIAGQYEPYINEDGDIEYFVSAKGGGVKDINKNYVDDMGTFKPLDKDIANSVKTITGSAPQKKAATSYTMLRDYNDIKGTLTQFTDEDLKAVDRPLLNVALTATGPELQTYLRNQKINLTPRAKRFFTQMAAADAKLRHSLFGAALTRLESGKSNAFMPGSAGLVIADSVDRMEALARSQYNVIAGIEQAQGMKPGTLTGNIKYDFPNKESLEDVNVLPEKLGTQPLTATSVEYSDEQLNSMSLQELQALVDSEAM